MSEPLRILHVMGTLSRGGTESFIMNLYRCADRSRIQFDFLIKSTEAGGYEHEILGMGGRVHRVNHIEKVGYGGYKRSLYQFFLAHPEYGIVHAHTNRMNGVVLAQARRAGVPVRISHAHSTGGSGNALIRLFKWWIGLGIPKNATKLFACSDEAARWMYGRSAARAEIVRNAVDVETFRFNPEKRRAARAGLGLDDSAFLIGHAGRFEPVKNHAFLLRVFAKVREKNKNAKLLLAGEGSLLESIKQSARDMGLADDCFFPGNVSNMDELASAMDALAFPSLYEGLGLVLIEAQAASLPAVASQNVPPAADAGLGLVKFLPLDDPDLWADALLTFGRDRDAGDADRVKAAGFDIHGVYAQILKTYEEAAGRLKSPDPG